MRSASLHFQSWLLQLHDFMGIFFYDKKEGFIFVLLGKVMTGSKSPVALSSVCFSFMFIGETIINTFSCPKYLLSGKHTCCIKATD